MPRPKTDPFWVDRIRELDTNYPRMTHAEMGRRLEGIGAEKGRNDWPSDRTMRTLRAKWKAPTFDEERRQYRYLHWPETFERGDLPWEASAAALELLREHHKRKFPRPMLALVRWFCRVKMAAPTLSFEEQSALAAHLYGCEVGGAFVYPISWRRAEAQLASGEFPESPFPESWFGEELGNNLMITVGKEGMVAVIMAAIPPISEQGAASIVRFLNEREEARKEGVQ